MPLESYEGKHRYDPKFEWEPKEEKKLVRKLDLRICSWACLMFFALQLDRGNISQALSDNMLNDLHMNTDDYNTGQTIFYLCFLSAELPSQLISKKLGPDRWIPIQMVSWSIVASLQSLLSGRSSFFVCRALLGILEGGFIPDNILYLSYFYTSIELPIRLSFFWVAYQSTSIVSAFLAFGILHLRGHHNLAGWRWLFALEGLLTGCIGLVSFLYLPPSPTQTRSWFRGRDGWFDEREERIMVNRILRDDPSKGDMHNRQALSPRALWRSLTDYDMWPIYLLGLSWLIPNYPMTQYLTLQLKAAGFGTFATNLLTIPAYVLFIAQLLWWTWVSEKTDQRFLTGLVSQIWALPLLVALETIDAGTGPWVKWALSTLLVGAPYVHAIIVAITSRNAGSVRTRTVASALYNMTVQASSVIGSNIYRNDDKPLYRKGNKVLIGICVYNMALFIGAKVFYIVKNRSRRQKWDAMTAEEKQTYLETTTDKGNKRLDFRFAH
ncbi:major facilitator superfamily domain-containing protein [Usnea florida]